MLANGVAGCKDESREGEGEWKAVDVQGQPFKQAIHFTSLKSGSPWSLEQQTPIPRDIAKGEVFLLGFWVRMINTEHESKQGIMKVEMSESSTPWQKAVGGGCSFPGEWRHYWARGAAPKEMKAGTVVLRLAAGTVKQEVEIAGIELLSYGVGYDLRKLPITHSTYSGREPDAPWRKEARERIAKLRMAPLRVKVIGANGTPVPSAVVDVEQTASAFQIGTVFSASQINDRTKPENEAWRQKIPELFNTIVLGNDLKWPGWIGDFGGSFTKEKTISALKWAKSKGLYVRGHNLVWPGRGAEWDNLPKSIVAMKETSDPARIQKAVLDHIDDISEATSEYVDEWDVMNEPCDNHALIDLCGKPAMADWFKRARQKLPKAHLAVNDYAILEALSDDPKHDLYAGYIHDLIKNGAPVDTIGMEGYFGNLVPSPMRMLKTLDRFGSLGPEILVTEYDIQSEDPAMVCDFTHDLLTLLYSHEKVRGFTTWYGVSKYITPEGALTPLGQTVSDLVNKEWKTRTALKTDASGQCSVRAHLGQYQVSVRVNGQTIQNSLRLQKDTPELVVRIAGGLVDAGNENFHP